ncbi:glycosyltransferase family 2 protein [Oribacterium sp. FC2011]|uniref:glycosyltransferase family 2 protein n=1 Tax=Oribacterium sp. FC2011 TaxID=1408311 RepID=UPI0004E13F8E|nr:glycosyltransferase family 2 protein [Oribacterium sp. FC2011]
MDSLYVVMPAYNEEDNIEQVVTDWYQVLDGKSEYSRIVIADFGSNDNTHKILEDLKNSKYPKLEILKNDNQFHGPKVLALYRYAIENGADYIFQTDSDGQTNPMEFDDFWNLREQYAGLFGNRTVRGDGNDRAFVEKVVCLCLKLYFGVNIPDANAPFRLMKASVLDKYMDRFSDNYNLPNIMITTFFSFYKEKIAFKEITFKPRQGGKNSLNIPKIVKIGWNALGDFSEFKRGMR